MQMYLKYFKINSKDPKVILTELCTKYYPSTIGIKALETASKENTNISEELDNIDIGLRGSNIIDYSHLMRDCMKVLGYRSISLIY